MYNIWCFFNRSSGFLERENHQQKDFPMEKDVDRIMLLISSTEPNTANAVDDVIVSDLININKETVPLLPSVDNAENSPKSEPSECLMWIKSKLMK